MATAVYICVYKKANEKAKYLPGWGVGALTSRKTRGKDEEEERGRKRGRELDIYKLHTYIHTGFVVGEAREERVGPYFSCQRIICWHARFGKACLF